MPSWYGATASIWPAQNGTIAKTQKDDPRGARYTVHGTRSNEPVRVSLRALRRYGPSETLKRVQEVATGAVAPERFDEIPVAHARQA